MKKNPTIKEELCSKSNQELALRLAVHGVRNTVIENYHAEGKISDKEMKAFNIEVVNNLFTYLEIFTNPKFKKEHDFVFGKGFGSFYKPNNWNSPELDERKIKGIHVAMEREASEKKPTKGVFSNL